MRDDEIIGAGKTEIIAGTEVNARGKRRGSKRKKGAAAMSKQLARNPGGVESTERDGCPGAYLRCAIAIRRGLRV